MSLFETLSKAIAPELTEFRFEIGDNVFFRANGEDEEVFTVEDRKKDKYGNEFYLIDDRWRSVNLLK